MLLGRPEVFRIRCKEFKRFEWNIFRENFVDLIGGQLSEELDQLPCEF